MYNQNYSSLCNILVNIIFNVTFMEDEDPYRPRNSLKLEN